MNLSEARPYVLPHVPGCPTPLADNAILRAAIRFCAKTGVWRADLAPVAAAVDTVQYAFAPPTGAKVERVLAAWIDGDPLTVKNATDMLGVRDWQTYTGTPKTLVVLNDTHFRLYPIGAGDIDLQVSLKPARNATAIDDAVFEAHVDAIADGALEILFGHPGKPWSSPDLTLYHKGEFERAIDDATISEFRHAPVRTARPPL